MKKVQARATETTQGLTGLLGVINMGKSSPRKRYGPVHKRGLGARAIRQARESKEQDPVGPRSYLVPVGTVCSVRKVNARGWTEHRTFKVVASSKLIRRSNKYLYLEFQAYEIRVKPRLVTVISGTTNTQLDKPKSTDPPGEPRSTRAAQVETPIETLDSWTLNEREANLPRKVDDE